MNLDEVRAKLNSVLQQRGYLVIGNCNPLRVGQVVHIQQRANLYQDWLVIPDAVVVIGETNAEDYIEQSRCLQFQLGAESDPTQQFYFYRAILE